MWSLSPGSKSYLVTIVLCVLFQEFYLAVMNRFVMRSSRDLHPSPNPASFDVTNTPSTFLSVDVSFAPGYLNLVAPSRPNLNLF